MSIYDYFKAKGWTEWGTDKEVKECHNCQHLLDTVCQIRKTVMKPNDSCSRWSN